MGVQIIIVISMIVLVFLSFKDLHPLMYAILSAFERIIVFVFFIEYLFRCWSAPVLRRYAFSFFGIVDFLAAVPAMLDLMGVGVRSLRLLRLLRILKFARLVRAERRIINAFRVVKDEIIVCLLASFILLFVASAGIYEFENIAQPDAFSSIPASFWWVISTLTTVGYGDVYPITAGGKIFTIAVLFIGLGVVAVPTGLIARALLEDDGERNER